VEQLYKDEYVFSAYSQVEIFCDCIITNLRDISKRRHRFGQEFERSNVELLPGNNVNSQTKHNLDTNPVSDDLKLQLTADIAKDYTLCLEHQVDEQNLVPKCQEFYITLFTSNSKDGYYPDDIEDQSFSGKGFHGKNKLSSKKHGTTKTLNGKCNNDGDKLSNDVSEVVSSLIFAASRCGELPELHLISNVELLPGNNVNSQTKHNLDTNPVSDDLKLQLTADIAKDYTLCLEHQVDEQNLVPKCQEFYITLFTSNSKDGYYPDDIEDQSFSGKGFHGKNKLSSKKHGTTKTLNGKCNNDGEYGIYYESIQENAIDYRKILVEEGFVLHNSYDDQEIVAHYEYEEIEEDSIPRLSHVHPKLPDYDELVTKFTYIKKDHMQKYSNKRALSRWMCW
ncbi:unnamed protein product, partial [Ilex paraguariensis]